MDAQTDERLLRNLQGYLIELVCDIEDLSEVSLVAEVLVSVQDVLLALAQKPNLQPEPIVKRWRCHLPSAS